MFVTIITVYSRGSAENTQRITELGALERLMDFIFWCVDQFTTTASSSLKMNQNEEYWTRYSPHITRKGSSYIVVPNALTSNTGSASTTSPPVRANLRDSGTGISFSNTQSLSSSMSNSPPSSPGSTSTRRTTKQLNQLFEVLFGFCKIRTPLASSSTAISHSPSKESSVSSNLNQVTKIIICLLLDIFNEDVRQTPNNTRVRSKLRYV